MLNGKWNVEMKTPMGVEHSVFNLTVTDGVITGTVEDEKNCAEVRDGVMEGNEFKFVAAIQIVFGKIDFTFIGKVDGDRLEGITKMSFPAKCTFVGTREN